MSDSRHMSKEFLTEFITIYKTFPCLWKVKSKEYANRDLKNAAYKELIGKLKEIDNGANRDTVIKKINSLRSVFRRELKKINASKKSGSAEEDVYRPNLWYFPQLMFLRDQEEPRRSISNLESLPSEDSLFDELIEIDSEAQDVDGDLSEAIPNDSGERSSEIEMLPPSSSKRKKPSNNDAADEVLGLVAKKLRNSSKNEAFGLHVAHELDQLRPEMLPLVKKVINDAIFEAQMGTLTRRSTILSEEPGTASRASTSLSQYFADFEESQG